MALLGARMTTSSVWLCVKDAEGIIVSPCDVMNISRIEHRSNAYPEWNTELKQ